ncbi:MAG: hypothetical protein AB7Y46_17195 [Armatimonadota bacterium]
MRLPSPSMIEDLTLTRLRPTAPAHAATVSLPVPPGAGDVALHQVPSTAHAIAWWPQHLAGEEACGQPRRLLIAISGDADLPAQMRPVAGAQPATGQWTGPTWQTRVLERNYLGTINWETGELVLRYGEREIGLRLGLLREDGTPMWWEWLQVEELWAGSACRAIRVAGYASAMRLTQDHPDVAEHRPPLWVHRHHWLLCEAVLLIFANGVIHVTARHVNNRLYDYGRDVPGLPIIALRCSFEGDIELAGEAVEVDLGGAVLSTEECRTLASPERPGALSGDGEVTIFRPYQAVEITLDGYGRRCEGPTWVCRPEEGIMPSGAARTVRFVLSMGAAPPRVERYTVPWWWYGLCAELVPDSVLPVHDERDAVVDAAAAWLDGCQLIGFFNDGSVPRGGSHYYEDGRARESGWEGEAPFNHIRGFYRRPSPQTWECALRDAYNVADIAVDHANFMFRMHGYDFGAISITMNRTLGLLQAYLETGDPYLRETAEHVALASSIIDASNWPRRSYGRDAMWIRGMIALDDYLPGRGHDVRARGAGAGHAMPAARGRLYRPGRPGGGARRGQPHPQALDELHGARADDGLAGASPRGRGGRRRGPAHPRLAAPADRARRAGRPLLALRGGLGRERVLTAVGPASSYRSQRVLVSRARHALRGEALGRSALPAGVGGDLRRAARLGPGRAYPAVGRRPHGEQGDRVRALAPATTLERALDRRGAGGRALRAARGEPARDHRDACGPARGRCVRGIHRNLRLDCVRMWYTTSNGLRCVREPLPGVPPGTRGTLQPAGGWGG